MPIRLRNPEGDESGKAFQLTVILRSLHLFDDALLGRSRIQIQILAEVRTEPEVAHAPIRMLKRPIAVNPAYAIT